MSVVPGVMSLREGRDVVSGGVFSSVAILVVVQVASRSFRLVTCWGILFHHELECDEAAVMEYSRGGGLGDYRLR